MSQTLLDELETSLPVTSRPKYEKYPPKEPWKLGCWYHFLGRTGCTKSADKCMFSHAEVCQWIAGSHGNPPIRRACDNEVVAAKENVKVAAEPRATFRDEGLIAMEISRDASASPPPRSPRRRASGFNHPYLNLPERPPQTRTPPPKEPAHAFGQPSTKLVRSSYTQHVDLCLHSSGDQGEDSVMLEVDLLCHHPIEEEEFNDLIARNGTYGCHSMIETHMLRTAYPNSRRVFGDVIVTQSGAEKLAENLRLHSSGAVFHLGQHMAMIVFPSGQDPWQH